ncbi:MAG TPA: sigma-70 family RNA polymerase sigma factor [Candidatus Binatia bacterium]
MNEQERSILTGCLAGEKAAWDAFVLQYSKLVYHTIRRTLAVHHAESRDEVVEDLYQECFLAFLRDDCKKLRQFRGERGCTLASWLRVVVSRETIDFLRKQTAPTVEVTETLSSDQAGALEVLVSGEEEQALARALDGLSPRDRLIVELSYRQGLPAEAIAEILKISVGAFYTQKSRLLGKLREVLA